MLSNADILFDLFIAIFYVLNIAYSSYATYKLRHTSAKAIKIFLVLFMVTSSIFLFQVGWQTFTQDIAIIRVWDIYNLIQAITNLVAVQILTRFSGVNLKECKPKAPVL